MLVKTEKGLLVWLDGAEVQVLLFPTATTSGFFSEAATGVQALGSVSAAEEHGALVYRWFSVPALSLRTET